MANANHTALLDIMQAKTAHIEWWITIGFYKAVHIAEACLATERKAHSTSHRHRNDLLTGSVLKPIFKDDKVLYNASRVAWYLYDCEGGHQYSTFSNYMDEARVKKLLRERLYRFEQQALPYLTKTGRKDLVKLNTAAFK